MAEVNIGGDPADRSYRYKRPRLQTKIEGRGNGIKTVIPNMLDISKALHIDPAYPTKFFGIELGAQSKYDKKTDRSVVNGAHNAGDLEVLLNKFIDIFILCPGCQLPEITIKIRKDNIKADCAACGFNGFLETKHRLTTYILKDRKDAKKDKNDRNDPSAKKKDRRARKKAAEGTNDDQQVAKQATGDPETVTWYTDTSNEAQEKRKAEELRSMGASGAEDVDKHIQEIARLKTSESSPQDIMRLFLSRNRELHEITSELRRLELSRNLDSTKKIGVLLLALLDLEKPRDVPAQLKKNATILLPFAKTRHDKTVMISNLEMIAGTEQPILKPRFALILQALYESDVLDEETILQWHSSPVESSWAVDTETAQELRVAARPFIEWLADAEESEEEADDDE